MDIKTELRKRLEEQRNDFVRYVKAVERLEEQRNDFVRYIKAVESLMSVDMTIEDRLKCMFGEEPSDIVELLGYLSKEVRRIDIQIGRL